MTDLRSSIPGDMLNLIFLEGKQVTQYPLPNAAKIRAEEF
jgi:hypothetical protein